LYELNFDILLNIIKLYIYHGSNKQFQKIGHVAEWLRRGLQILVSQFDSGRGLQKKILS
jgi:hypothetical protein